MNENINSYEDYITMESYKKIMSYAAIFFIAYLIVVIQEAYQVIYFPILQLRISQLVIIVLATVLCKLAYTYDRKHWIIPIYAMTMILSLINDLAIWTLVQSIDDIPEVFTKYHPIGLICFLMILSIGAMGARKYCKYAFPIILILYDINCYFIGIENIPQLTLINVLTIFLSYQMHIQGIYDRKYFYAFKHTLDKKDSQLVETNKVLKGVNKKLNDINFALSHDLKTPVHNIRVFSGILKTELKNPPNELIAQYLKFIHQSSEHIYDLIEGMSHYANLSYGVRIKSEEVDLSRVFDNLKNNYQSLIHENKLILTLEKKPPNIKGNYHMVYMLLQNIIDNGVIYNQSKLKRIEVNHFQKNGKVYVEITDNGIGIPEAYHTKIFKPFKRLHNKNVYKGSGMGLAFCAEIMEQLGGSIQLISEINKGSKFQLEFS